MFQPVMPSGGNLGWAFLSRTRETQETAFRRSETVARSTDYFREKIGSIRTAQDLVADRRLLTVALGAFGLDEDIGNRFFVQKALEEGTLSDESFANRLSDKRYFQLSKAFGFDLSPPRTVLSTFADEIVEAYNVRQFEVAVGAQDGNLRLALGLGRELDSLSREGMSKTAKWFTIMGNPPLRRVFETAFGLPASFGAIDLDRQLAVFEEKSIKGFGTSDPSDFADDALREKLVQSFLFRADLADSRQATTRGAVALSLLQSVAPLT